MVDVHDPQLPGMRENLQNCYIVCMHIGSDSEVISWRIATTLVLKEYFPGSFVSRRRPGNQPYRVRTNVEVRASLACKVQQARMSICGATWVICHFRPTGVA